MNRSTNRRSMARRVVIELVMPVEPDLAGVLQPVQCRLARERAPRVGRVPPSARDRSAAHRGRSGPRSRAPSPKMRWRRGRRGRAWTMDAACGDRDEACRQPLAQPDPSCRPPCEQHHAAVRRDRTAVESAHKFAPARASEVHLMSGYTVSASGSTSCCRPKSLSQKHFR